MTRSPVSDADHATGRWRIQFTTTLTDAAIKRKSPKRGLPLTVDTAAPAAPADGPARRRAPTPTPRGIHIGVGPDRTRPPLPSMAMVPAT